MILPELRVLAEKALEWMPPCGVDGPYRDDAHRDACYGARLAVEDVDIHVSNALSYVESLPTDPLRDGDTATTKLAHAEYEARCATRIASYFGSPGPVAAFEAGVREMCNG